VKIDGESPTQGKFSATAERVSYTQMKEQLILEGNNRVPATLRHLVPTTGQQVDNSAGKIIYNRLTGEVQWDTVRSFDFTPGSGGGVPRSATGPGVLRQ
jgi:hypothetical protein